MLQTLSESLHLLEHSTADDPVSSSAFQIWEQGIKYVSVQKLNDIHSVSLSVHYYYTF